MGVIPIQEKHGLKITSDMKYLMMLYAIDMGYSLSPSNSSSTSMMLSTGNQQANHHSTSKCSSTAPSSGETTFASLPKSKKDIHEAACKIVCYDYGLMKPIGASTLHKAFESFRKNKYVHTVNLFETHFHDRGRKSYVQRLEEEHPGYLKSLFLYAREKSNEYTKYDDYRKMMVERSRKVKPDLDIKLTMNDLMNFFDKNPKLRPRGMPKRKKSSPVCNEGDGGRDGKKVVHDDSSGDYLLGYATIPTAIHPLIGGELFLKEPGGMACSSGMVDGQAHGNRMRTGLLAGNANVGSTNQTKVPLSNSSTMMKRHRGGVTEYEEVANMQYDDPSSISFHSDGS